MASDPGEARVVTEHDFVLGQVVLLGSPYRQHNRGFLGNSLWLGATKSAAKIARMQAFNLTVDTIVMVSTNGSSLVCTFTLMFWEFEISAHFPGLAGQPRFVLISLLLRATGKQAGRQAGRQAGGSVLLQKLSVLLSNHEQF